MSTGKVVTIGSRGSRLALLQDEEVLRELRPLYPDVDFQVVTVRTHGDVNAAAPLTGMGIGIFVKEIERELLEGRLNMAVHSLKDLPTKLPEGLALGAVLRRQDPRDVLVNRWHCSLDQLPQGARIGTSSPRRLAQLKRACPLAVAVPIRGNVETRIRKALGEECDGAILAASGLIRLGLADHIAEYLSPQQFVPPPGQGALAVEVRADDSDMLELVRPIEHPETRFAVAAERAFLETLGGGCQLPVGAYARSEGELLLLTVFMSSPDGRKTFQAKLEGLTHDPLQLASDAYLALVERGGGPLLETDRSGFRE